MRGGALRPPLCSARTALQFGQPVDLRVCAAYAGRGRKGTSDEKVGLRELATPSYGRQRQCWITRDCSSHVASAVPEVPA